LKEGKRMADRVAPLDVAQLVASHHAALYRYAYRLTGSVPDAEDLTQQAFLAAQQNVEQVRAPEAARAWLFTVLRNAYFKSARRRRPLPMARADFDINAIPAEAPDDTVDSEQLQTAIDALSDDFKIVVMMFYFEHHSYQQIAERLGVPSGTVMSRLARAKAHLRCHLSQSARPRRLLADPVDEVAANLNPLRRPTMIGGGNLGPGR
jgi:RNA polymerase sigma-70 factor, ECF subfamily